MAQLLPILSEFCITTAELIYFCIQVNTVFLEVASYDLFGVATHTRYAAIENVNTIDERR